MSVRDVLVVQRENSQICIEILLQCKTREQTILGFAKAARILRASNDPAAKAAEVAYQLSQSMDEASVLQSRDEFIQQLRAFLASTESMLTEPIALEKPSSTAGSAKPKGMWGCLLATCGSFMLAIVLIFIVGGMLAFTGGAGVADDPAVVLVRTAICILPIVFIGVGLLVIGIRKIRSQRKRPAAAQQFAEADPAGSPS